MKPHSLIIGGTRGIGRALARALSAEGHRVTVVGRNPPADRIAAGVRHYRADVLEIEKLPRTLDEILSKRGPVNSLVCLQRYRGQDNAWKGEMETSLSATRFLIEYLADHFAKGPEKSIVLVSSAASRVIADEQPVGYHVAKAGLEQMARYYAATLGARGFRVNTVSPGTVLKDENREYYMKKKAVVMNLFQKLIPLGRMGTADEVAQAIVFLCSSRSSFITGQNLLVDGGVSLLSQETLIQKFARGI